MTTPPTGTCDGPNRPDHMPPNEDGNCAYCLSPYPADPAAHRAAMAWMFAILGNPFRHARHHMHPQTAALIDQTIDTFRKIADGTPCPTEATRDADRPVPHRPQRGSDVETWIRQNRDNRPAFGPDGNNNPEWTILDDLLDTYRKHADTGRYLDHPISGPHPEQS